MNRKYLTGSICSLALWASAANAAPKIYALDGSLGNAQGLTFAVFNGNLVSANPQPNDLPLNIGGRLVVDDELGTASFEFFGGFFSPNRSYTFDPFIDNLGPGLVTLNDDQVVIEDVFANFDFSLDIDLQTGTGTFAWVQPGGIPSNPPQDRFAFGSLTVNSILVVGDANCDGAVNGNDIADLTFELTGAGSFGNGCPDELLDINGDGVLNALDIPAFVDLLLITGS